MRTKNNLALRCALASLIKSEPFGVVKIYSGHIDARLFYCSLPLHTGLLWCSRTCWSLEADVCGLDKPGTTRPCVRVTCAFFGSAQKGF